MARARLSWKWKLVLSFILLFLVLMVAALTPWGHNLAKNWIREAYNTMPENERRDSPYADWWMRLAWWAGNVRGDTGEAMRMYVEFCGANIDQKNRDFTVTLKLDGLCSPDGKTGWGPFHKRAPEAFFSHLEFLEIEKSSQRHNAEIVRMYRLFYQWGQIYGEKKINPCFKKYWQKLMERAIFRRVKWPADVDRAIQRAPTSPPDC
jgi:hypothetical protein